MLNYIANKCRMYQTKFSFGAASGIITNLGLIAGLKTSEHARVEIIGGILVIALADNISDSVGIHIYQESECLNQREVWISTITNFLARLLLSLTFVLLIFFLPIKAAVVTSMVWGLSLLAMLSYTIAKGEEVNPYLAVLEHVGIAAGVILASNFLGKWLISTFTFLG
jgi:VIT1/CCC1 family predicted Fe2+/Mn2+ transporter